MGVVYGFRISTKNEAEYMEMLLKKIIILIVSILFLYLLTSCLKEKNNTETISNKIDLISLSDVAKSNIIEIYTINEIVDNRYLELVNNEYAIRYEPNNEFSLLESLGTRVRTQQRENNLVRGSIRDLLEAANESGLRTLTLNSIYRDYETQKELYESATDKRFVQRPNHSEHQTGLAVDITAIGVTQDIFGKSKEGQWLAANSWKYGFILRYPEGKEHITGIAYEPWHFRYVGLIHAWFIQENNIVLEEYINFLKEHEGFIAKKFDREYIVLYQVPIDGTLNIPKTQYYNVSNDNTGGYIITAWNDIN